MDGKTGDNGEEREFEISRENKKSKIVGIRRVVAQENGQSECL